MSRKYKFHNKEGLYFVSFAVINWIDVFIRPLYAEILIESLKHCKDKLGLELFCWCIMPSHVHLIFRTTTVNPEVVLGRFKEYTSKQLVKAIKENMKESRREWMLERFKLATQSHSRNKNYQFWQYGNHPEEIYTNKFMWSKLDYIHLNPVRAGLVEKASHFIYSSASNYVNDSGLIEIEKADNPIVDVMNLNNLQRYDSY